jgi:hypothetical protein
VRRSLLSVVLFALPLACAVCTACTERDVPITPDLDRSAAIVTPSPVPSPPFTPGAEPEVALPKPANGVLAAGEADKVLPAGSPPLVKLLEAGTDAHDLSYALTKGASQKMAMAMDMAVGIKAKGQTLPQTPMPRMTMTFDTLTADRSAAGEFKIESHLVGTSVDPSGGQQEQMARALRPQVEGMKGLGMAYWVTAKGHVHDVKLDVPPTVPAAAQQILTGMSQSFESMVIPLPPDPVGVGGRWQVVSRLSAGGLDVLQSAIYTLKSRTGARATLDVALVQLAAADTIHTPQMPPGMSAKVKSFNSTGKGTNQVDLKSVAPEGGTTTLVTAMDIAVQGSGSTEESSVETTTRVQVTRP